MRSTSKSGICYLTVVCFFSQGLVAAADAANAAQAIVQLPIVNPKCGGFFIEKMDSHFETNGYALDGKDPSCIIGTMRMVFKNLPVSLFSESRPDTPIGSCHHLHTS